MSERTFKRSARRLLESQGVPCTLTRYNGGEVVADLHVHLSRDVEFTTAGETQTPERRTEVEMLTEDVGTLKKRDVIDVGAQSWVVEEKLSNDGYTVRAVVIEE